jgi:hypothetical protein
MRWAGHVTNIDYEGLHSFYKKAVRKRLIESISLDDTAHPFCVAVYHVLLTQLLSVHVSLVSLPACYIKSLTDFTTLFGWLCPYFVYY